MVTFIGCTVLAVLGICAFAIGLGRYLGWRDKPMSDFYNDEE